MEQVFPFSPNWRSPVLERLTWMTDVFEARDLTESRTPLRSFPRRHLEYELLEVEHNASVLDALLWGWQAKQYVLPMWTDPQRLQSALPAGSGSIPVAIDGYDFYDGGRAVLWQDEQNYELVTIDIIDTDTAGDTYLNLDGVTVAAWPVGTRLYPARLGRINPDTELTRITAAVVRGSVLFELDNSASTNTDDTDTYLGVPVNTRRPNWASGVNQTYQRKLARFDYELGTVATLDVSELPVTTTSYRYAHENRADIADWRQWLHAREGRYKAFWQPQWLHDIQLTQAIAPADDILRIKALGMVANYNADTNRRDIALRHRSGVWYYRRIIAAGSAGAGLEDIQLNSALGITANPTDFTHITWLVLSRLDADAIELNWITSAVATCDIAARSVRA